MTLTDRAWPTALRLLLGPDAHQLLDATAEQIGHRLVDHRPMQVNHQPGRSTTVQYRVRTCRPDGVEAVDTYVAMTGRGAPESTAVFERGPTRVSVWNWRHDPALDGLQQALDPHAVARLLDELALRRAGDLVPTLTTRAYRPGRRAVVQASVGECSVYLKVVRPGAVEDLHRVHRRLARSVPVPDSLGWSNGGILVLPGLPGSTLRAVLRSSSAHDLAPAPADVSALLDLMPNDAGAGIRREPVVAARHHAQTIGVVAPTLRSRVERLVERLESQPSTSHALVPVHGDLYEAQLLVDDGRLCGMLDLDTFGCGHRIDDLANFCAHLSVLALTMRAPGAVKRYGASLLAHAEASFDRADLRTRIAAYVVGLATGPFRVQEASWLESTERRLAIAEQWLGSRNRTAYA